MQEVLHAKLSTSGASDSGGKFSMRQPNYPRLSPLPTPVISLTRAKRSAAVSESPSGSATRYDTIGGVSKWLG